jgi:hypothetical protein
MLGVLSFFDWCGFRWVRGGRLAFLIWALSSPRYGSRGFEEYLLTEGSIDCGSDGPCRIVSAQNVRDLRGWIPGAFSQIRDPPPTASEFNPNLNHRLF